MQALRIQRLVHQQLHHHQLVDGHQSDPLEECLEARVELGGGRGLDREPPLVRLAAGEQVAGEEQPLGALRPDAVRPQCGGGYAPHPRRRVADPRVLGDDEEVRAERHVGPAGHAEAVHLADHGLVRVEERHEAADVAAHHRVVDRRIPGARRVVVSQLHERVQRRPLGRAGVGDALHAPLGARHQVVAAAEPLPVAGQRDHVHPRIQVGPLHRLGQLARHLERDAVPALWTVERDPGDPAVDLVGEGAH